MPRVKTSPKKCVKSNVQQTPNTWVFLLKGEAIQVPEQYTGNGTPDLVNLRHPSTGRSAMFLFSPGNESIQEILSFSDTQRSWFIDESVKSDGKMQLSTPIDPSFLVIPYLRKHCTDRAMPLDQLLRDDDFPETERLLKSSGLKYLNVIADRKGAEDLNAFKYNEEKTLAWLRKKTERVAEILKQKNIHVSAGAVSATFVRSSKAEQSDESFMRYAHGIVSEYLESDLSKRLLEQLDLPEETPPPVNKRKSTTNSSSPSKKIKLEESSQESLSKNGSVDLSQFASKTKQSPTLKAKDQKRAKAASGSKSITSFFKKK